MGTIAQGTPDVNGKDRCILFRSKMRMLCLLPFGMKIALIDCRMRSRGYFLFICVFLLGVCASGWSTVQKPGKFTLGINAGLGRWTNRINRDILIYPLPSFPQGYGFVIADTDSEVNYHLGINLKYDVTPNVGLQAEFSRINAEYLVVIGLNSIYRFDPPRYDMVDLPWKVTTVYINGIYNIGKTRGSVFPFAFAGVGFNILHKNRVSGEFVAVESESNVDLGLKGGGGINYNLPGGFLSLELRAFLLYLTNLGVTSYTYQSYTSPAPEIGGENLVWAVDLGLKYRF
jgi:hypothetical protein